MIEKAMELTAKQAKVATCYLIKLINKYYIFIDNKFFLRMHSKDYFIKTSL